MTETEQHATTSPWSFHSSCVGSNGCRCPADVLSLYWAWDPRCHRALRNRILNLGLGRPCGGLGVKKPNQWRFSQLKEISQKKAWRCSHKRKVTYRPRYVFNGRNQYLQSSQPVSAAVGRFFKVVALAVDDLQTCCTSRLDHVLCILRLKAKTYNEHGHFRQVVLSEAGNM